MPWRLTEDMVAGPALTLHTRNCDTRGVIGFDAGTVVTLNANDDRPPRLCQNCRPKISRVEPDAVPDKVIFANEYATWNHGSVSA